MALLIVSASSWGSSAKQLAKEINTAIMRTGELALIIGESILLLILCLPFFKQYRRPLPLFLLSFILILLAVLHIVYEGTRWQMIPAYVVTGGILLRTCLPLLTRQRPKRPSSWLQVLISCFAFLLLLVSTAAGYLFPVFALPAPTGIYPVGTVTYDWTDTSRTDPFSPHRKRELMVQVWYPSSDDVSAPLAPYATKATFDALALELHIPPFLLEYLTLVKTHARVQAPLASRERNYPLLLFSSGLESFRTQSTFLMEQLASQGYIVASVDYPSESAAVVFANGRIALPKIQVPGGISAAEDRYKAQLVTIRVADTRFVVDTFLQLNAASHTFWSGKIDVSHIGMLGHSLGGATAIQACQDDARFKACLNLDGELRAQITHLKQPIMFMETTNEQWDSALDKNRQLQREEALFESPGNDRYKVVIQGAGHLNFTDLPLIPTPLLQTIHSIGGINAERGANIIEAYTEAFFATYLKNKTTPLLGSMHVPKYPEVTVYHKAA